MRVQNLVLDYETALSGIYTRTIWEREGRRHISIPKKQAEQHEIELGTEMTLAINLTGKMYLTRPHHWGEGEDPVKREIGPYLGVPIKIRKMGRTLFFTIPNDVIGMDTLRKGQPVVFANHGKEIIQLVPIIKEDRRHGEGAADQV